MNMIRDNKWLTTKEVADFLHINEKRVYVLVETQGLPATKVTGKWLFPIRLVEDWLYSHTLNYSKTRGDDSSFDKVLLLAGSSDLLLQETISLFFDQKGYQVESYSNIGSMDGLKSLMKRICHINVCHFYQNDEDEYQLYCSNHGITQEVVLVSFAQRRQGLIVKKGNPKKIKTISDLVRDDVQIVNRPLGTGTRQLFDNEISKSGISSSQINGYQTEVYHHIDAGLEVVYGRVDSAPGSQAVSDTLDLDFIPLCWEWLGFLILREHFFEDRVQSFISLLLKKKFQMLAKSFNGYDVSLSGQILYPYRFKQEDNV